MTQDVLRLSDIERLRAQLENAPKLTPLILREKDGASGMLLMATDEQVRQMERLGLLVVPQ